jgi:hypothetical protein
MLGGHGQREQVQREWSDPQMLARLLTEVQLLDSAAL